MRTNPKDPVYPTDSYYDEIRTGQRDGMTKLEYFSALILAGLAADSEYHAPTENKASLAVEYAKALIEELRNQKDF
jgi:hypothetical protein